MNITKKQITVIHTARHRLNLDDDTYHYLLETEFGVKSCTELTSKEASRLIEHFISRGFVLNPRKRQVQRQIRRIPRNSRKIIALASPREIDKINALSELIEWRVEDGIFRWMEKRFGIDRVRTSGQAFNVIEGLKKMFENRMKKEFGDDWWMMDFDKPEIQLYIHEHCPKEFRKHA